ncbi:MAG: DUF4956 domain-containing protein [Spirosomaceae bacterium]|jgi:hypothetical protein|nr:DUF4956 domain-containing protein [Spirosomataceae bacterium]
MYQFENLFYRFLLDLAAILLLIRLIYYPIYKKDEFYFPFFIFNTIIFLLTFLLNSFEMSMGAAFGLFAVFSMLRYKTEDISMKDMTYLFLVIAIGLINAVMKSEIWEVAIINAVVILITYLLESNRIIKRESSLSIVYNNFEMILPEKRNELTEDLKLKMGLNIHRIEIDKVDYMKNTIQIRVFYYE